MFGGGANLQVLNPHNPSSRHLNDASIVVKVTFGNTSFMFTGDAETGAEREILNWGYDLKSTFLKVGHHGSNTSTTDTFLKAVNPKVAVIMVVKNSHGHPHDATLTKLAAANVDIYRTDVHGNIVITTDGQSYDINPKAPYQYTPQKTPVPDPDPTAPEQSVDTPAGQININTASLEELQEIVHIGPDRAQEIINKRPFSSLDGLSAITGIEPARLRDIKDEGLAYVK